MNEGDESLPSTKTKKKRRGSGFKYSSKKDLECSRVKKRTAKAGISELAFVTKALSYSRGLSSGCAAGSGGPHCLDIVEEHDEESMELSHNIAIIDGDCPLKVRNFLFWLIHCFLAVLLKALEILSHIMFCPLLCGSFK
jgi:hypothetical protein